MSASRLPLDARSRDWILLWGDVAALALATGLALWLGGLRSGWPWTPETYAQSYLRWLLLLAPLWLAISWANGHANPHRLPRGAAAFGPPARVGLQLLGLWALAYFIPPPWTLVRHIAVFFALLAAFCVGLWHMAYRRIFDRHAFRMPLIILGAGDAGRTILRVVRAEAPEQYDLVGFIDDDPALRGSAVDGLRVLGDRRALIDVVDDLGVAELVVAITHGLSPDLFRAVLAAQERGVRVTPMPLLYERLTARVPVEHIGEQWAVALPLDPPEAKGLYRLGRRALDGVAGLVGLGVLALLLPILGPWIRLDSAGPIFYSQVRVGRGGRLFKLYKLRSMRADAEEDGPQWASAGDARVTGLGRLLRRARLDELPQAINILRGEMSLIGPRPERPEFVAELVEQIPYYRARHAIRPGLTGWAAIHQPYAATPAEALVKLQYDLYYIKHRSLAMDGLILLRTVAMVLRLAGR